MSVTNFMNYFLSTAAEGFAPSNAPLKNNKHLNIPYQSTQPRRGKNKSESQGLTPSSWIRACGTKKGGWGRASILSVMPNAAPNTFPISYSPNLSCSFLTTCPRENLWMEDTLDPIPAFPLEGQRMPASSLYELVTAPLGTFPLLLWLFYLL